jgi:uncharacterized protein YbcC (UPF0753/DUF2309 family)
MHSSTSNPRELILEAISHLDHVLPGQAPIHDFVHHNTLHGFQHLPFEQALAAFTELTGIDCYLSDQQFRRFYQQGRIDDQDIDAGLASLKLEQTSLGFSQQTLYRVALLNDLSALSPAALRWQLPQLTPKAQDLWQAIVTKLDLPLTDANQESIEATVPAEQYRQQLDSLFNRVGDELTLRGLLLVLSGKDCLEQVRPQLIRICGSVLDEGMAAWRLPQRQTLGLYQAWRQSAVYDAQAIFQELSDWPTIRAELPDEPVEAIIQQLTALAIPQARWADYLQRLALELPGWSGLINWRQTHPAYQADDNTQPQLADYLALRLILDRLYLQALCQQLGLGQARFDKLYSYFNHHLPELVIRQAAFSGQLPEFIQQACHSLLADKPINRQASSELAQRINNWQQQQANAGLTAHQHGWCLLQLCLALNISTEALQSMDAASLLQALAVIDQFSQAQRSQIWLVAYERHYQQNLLQALHENHNRGRWAQRQQRPEAQLVFCMDDREEGIRRHLEELNPNIETLGAAGFFGLASNYLGLDDVKLTPLCPVVVTPAHNVEEHSQDAQLKRHQHGRQLKQRITDLVHHGLRRDTLLAYPLINLIAPLTLAGLLGKSFFPKAQQTLMTKLAETVSPTVATELQFKADNQAPTASPEHPRLGLTDQEQADRVAGFLRNTGLTYGFAEWVVLLGHGSISHNNPHLSAYDCGACSGRHGGPNARLFAAIANRPAVRALLAERGIVIPDDTWFIGAEHNTCDEAITYYDLERLPAERLASFQQLDQQLQHGQRMSAHERCRRLASAPRQPSPAQALRHFWQRSADFSQARPELGHATNAAAFVGRRSQTQGAFFDRRLFLISYDPTQDLEGKILEGILLAVGPVGAGINLEYYFSTVNNERLGCGSKVPHNITGFFAVMEGAGSDLRTGLPKQMVEIHEAMRLQMIVEAKTSVLEQIYSRQPSLQELIGGGWVHLSSKDPDTGEIFVFQRGVGFVAWQASDQALPIRDNSPDCYRQESQPVPAMLIKQALFQGAKA